MAIGNKSYPAAKRLQARELYMGGLNKSEIARQLKINISSINQWARIGNWESDRGEMHIKHDAELKSDEERFVKPYIPELTEEERQVSQMIVKDRMQKIADAKLKQTEAVQNLHAGAINAIGLIIQQTLSDLKEDGDAKHKRMVRQAAANTFKSLGITLSDISRANGMVSPNTAIKFDINNNMPGSEPVASNEDDIPTRHNVVRIIFEEEPLPDNHDETSKIIEADAVIEKNNQKGKQ